MNRTKRPSLVLPLAAAKPDPGPKLRRRLQKVKRPGQSVPNDVPAGVNNNNKLDTATKPCLPLPPDLSDSKWSEYLRGSGYICETLDSSPRPSVSDSFKPPPSPVSIIPELSHLNINNARQPRASSDTLASQSSGTSASAVRRRAKTPVRHIGELEARARARKLKKVNEDLTNHFNNGSSEDIAEQYKSLLAPGHSMFIDSHSEPPPSREGLKEEGAVGRRQSADSLRRDDTEMAQTTDKAVSPIQSPTTSDDGTLVAFEEETIYFKPMSFSPEPLSPVSSFEQPMASPLPSLNRLSLGICVDLLSRELGAAVTKRRAPEEALLQVWTMIEGYERLRAQIVDAPGLRFDEILTLEQTFDTWLTSLYAIHDRLTGADQESVSDYGEMERETQGLGRE